MKAFRKLTKAATLAFTWLTISSMGLVAENAFAESESLGKYHVALAAKYGYQEREVSTTRVANPEQLRLLKQISENSRRKLVEFASSIDANAFTYNATDNYWRLNQGDRVLSYTFSIDILKNEVKLFDYYCFAILEQDRNSGLVVDCSAYPYSASQAAVAISR